MAFKLAAPSVDFGQTAIENIWIDDLMASADGDALKVYLMGYRLACTGDANFSNETIAKRLNLPIDQVTEAWHYWQAVGVVNCVDCAAKHSDHQFDVVFYSLRAQYLANGKLLPVARPTKPLTPASKLLAALSNPHIKKMFEDIEFYARRILTSDEKNRVLGFLEHYHMETDVVVMAFYITYEERNIKRKQLNYVEGIIKNWQQDGIFDLATLRRADQTEIAHYQLLRTICRALGINQRQIPTALREAVADWCDVKHYDEDFILYVVDEATRRTNNPNLNYLHYHFERIAASGNCTVDGAKQYFGDKRSAAGNGGRQGDDAVRPTKFQNFPQNEQAELANMLKKMSNLHNKTGDIK